MKYTIKIGNVTQQAVVSQPHGAAGVWYVIVDDMYTGSIIMQGSNLNFHPSVKDSLPEDVVKTILKDIRKKHDIPEYNPDYDLGWDL
jgi:hypothetical protein